jgi:hypothetical protein
MSLPLDEPLHAKFLRRPYAYGLSALFESSPWANGVSVGLSVVLAIVYGGWSGTIGVDWTTWADFGDRYAHWGDYPGFWLRFYWHSDFRTMFAEHGYFHALEAATPIGIKGLYFLAAQFQIPFGLFHGGLISILAMAIAGLSCSLTLSFLPVPLAGVLAGFLSLQSVWSGEMPLIPDPKTWGYVGLLLCFCALNYRDSKPTLPPVLSQNTQGGILTALAWLKTLHWRVLSSIVFLALFSPTYLFLVFGVFSLQVIDRLAIVPVGRKAQTVQEFLDWSKQQYSHQSPQKSSQDHSHRTPRSRRRKKQTVEWKFQVRSSRLWDLYFPSLGLILVMGLLYGMINHWGAFALSRQDMLQQPAFDEQGLWPYFYGNPWHSWLMGLNSGFIPPLAPPLLWSGLVLPLWLRPWGLGQLPLLRQVGSTLSLLGELLVVSLMGFVLAHAFVLQLGWPQDFVWASHRLGLTIATSIFLTAIVEGIAQALGRSGQRWWGLVLGIAILGIIVRFPLIHITAPANGLSPIPTEAVLPTRAMYDRLQADPRPQILISTLAFRDTLEPEHQHLLDALQTIAPVYFTPSTLTPSNKAAYEQQRQQLKELLAAAYLAPRSEFLAFVDQFTAPTQAEPLWLLEKQSFTLENWSQYGRLQHLYPNLNRRIIQKFNPPGSHSPSFLETIVTSPALVQPESCRIQSGDWIMVNLSKRCLPR